MGRKASRTAERIATAALLAAALLGIGYVGHMDAQDERAKHVGASAYFEE